MCFSATASFAASALLAGGACGTLRQMRTRSQLLFALYPLLYAIQQCAEGVVWISLSYPSLRTLNVAATAIFLAFSHVIWPTVVPLSLLLMENAPWHRRALTLCTVFGILVSYYTFVQLFILNGFTSRISSCYHLIYVFQLPYTHVVEVLYFITTVGSFFAARNRRLYALGIFVALSFVAGRIWYMKSFISVSCFFAAGVSVLVYVILRWPALGKGREPHGA